LRWLAHRALPYPTFVLSPLRAATILGVTAESFKTVVAAGEGEFAAAITAATYRGQLADLAPGRLWRAGVAELAEEVAGPVYADDAAAIGQALARQVAGLEPLDAELPVVCIDDDYAETDDVADESDCVRLSPDGWPAFADQAWVSRERLTKATRAMRAPQFI
jgi:hypothetical protein